MKRQLLTGLLTTALATVLSSIAKPAQAFSFGTAGIQFDADTTVDFTFDQSHGAYQSGLYIYQFFPQQNQFLYQSPLFWETQRSDNGAANEWQGTFGNAVTSGNGQISQTFTFLQGAVYSLVLWSDAFTNNPFDRYVASSTWINTPFDPNFKNGSDCTQGCQQAVFGNFNLNYGSTQPFATANGGQAASQFQTVTLAQLQAGIRIAFDDRGNGNDADFQDFVITARTKPVPEPATIAGLGLTMGLILLKRQRKVAKV